MSDDPRLTALISQGSTGDIVLVGCPYDFLRKRSIGKGGEDNGPCCLRRFYGKVGTLVNPEFGIDIRGLNVSDYGNVGVEMSREEEDEKFKNVSSRKFKGEFINYYKESPEKIIENISNVLLNLINQNKVPFVFGGSKEGLMASVDAFNNSLPEQNGKVVYLLSGKPFLDRPFDGNKATSENVCTILNDDYKNLQFKVFGVHEKYFPSQYLHKGTEEILHVEKLPNFEFITYSQIRSHKQNSKVFEFGSRTQGLHKFMELYNKNSPAQVNITLEVLEVFQGCRDLSVQGLELEEFLEIMMFLGGQSNLQSISINEFNPSCEDYESSLIILNGLYYFLMGRTKI